MVPFSGLRLKTSNVIQSGVTTRCVFFLNIYLFIYVEPVHRTVCSDIYESNLNVFFSSAGDILTGNKGRDGHSAHTDLTGECFSDTLRFNRFL